MGSNRGWHKAPNSDEKYQWKEVDRIEGIKVLQHKSSTNKALPLYSEKMNTRYFHMNKVGEVDQLRIYHGRNVHMDIDWGHYHKGIPKGVVHYHIWKYDKNLKRWTRTDDVRLLSERQISKWGRLIRKANPNARFRLP